MQVGQVYAWERTFTEGDVRDCTRLSGDAGIHHIERDANGRLMVQGLLTASLPTKVGGDINFIAREMTFHFSRPVYAGDTVRCEVTLTELISMEQSLQLAVKFVCWNQNGKEVMTGHGNGVVRQPREIPG